MVELYVQYDLSDETWNMLRNMALHGILSMEKWEKFFDKCKDWRMDEEKMLVIDGNENVIYRRDDQGFMVKV